MKDFQLFDYQSDMVSRVQSAFERYNSVMVQMPTGTGKTHVLAAIVGLFLNQNVWVVAHRRELVSQIKETLGRFFSSVDAERIHVTSIQWLSKHYDEIVEKPCLIVIDEAHHALAETYAEVMGAFPKAKKLGLTATPYRMNGKGFTDLFDTLLCSWSMERFIAKGRLSLYDYYSIKPKSVEQLLIDSLKKRGADGDYQQKEMCDVFDVKPSLERLCQTVKEYVPGKKGIVYAISIQHAEHIAEFYRENGIDAVAISSKTPLAERKELIARFKNTNSVPQKSRIAQKSLSAELRRKIDGSAPARCLEGLNTDSTESTDIQVLVSVDLFSEGFDCPDVEFIQLARPTLSLAKYMQMVGRGLRVTEGKECCVILDNVGLYRRFGLLSAAREWQSMFEGRTALSEKLQEVSVRLSGHRRWQDDLTDGDDKEMMQVFSHERLRMNVENSGEYVVVEENGRYGVKKGNGDVVLECIYASINMTDDGFAKCLLPKKRGKKTNEKPWVDLQSGLWFAQRPVSVNLMGIDFCTEDGYTLWPRIRSKFVDDKASLTVKTLELQVGAGLNWKRRYIPWNEPTKVYSCQESCSYVRIYVDDEGYSFGQKNICCPLVPLDDEEAVAAFKKECAEEYEKMEAIGAQVQKDVESVCMAASKNELMKNGVVDDDKILFLKGANDKHIWMDLLTSQLFTSKPKTFNRGYVKIVQDGDWCFVRNIPGLKKFPLKSWEIVADDNICMVGQKELYLKDYRNKDFKVVARTDDFSMFAVEEGEEYGHPGYHQKIRILQSKDGKLTLTRDGLPYDPNSQNRPT